MIGNIFSSCLYCTGLSIVGFTILKLNLCANIITQLYWSSGRVCMLAVPHLILASSCSWNNFLILDCKLIYSPA